MPTTDLSTLPDTPMFSPSAMSETLELSQTELIPQTPQPTAPTSRDKLNAFLASRDISPVRTTMVTSWDRASERTKRHYLRKARQVLSASLDEISPLNSEIMLKAIKESHDTDGDHDETLLEALAECFENATHWRSRRQILSIFADKVSFKVISQWLPEITRYRYNIARHHQLLHGRGTEVAVEKRTRVKISLDKLDHFIAFITSSRVIQDMPYGEKSLKMSSGVQLKIPNVIRNSISDQIIKQYQSYCQEIGFNSSLSKSTMYRILDVCSASLRTSLQGLDYFSAEGSKAFDDLDEVVDKLGDIYNFGLTWSKEQKRKLKLAKRYLKTDYKVRNISVIGGYICELKHGMLRNMKKVILNVLQHSQVLYFKTNHAFLSFIAFII